MIAKKQLEKFVKVRNKSSFNSNLQFQSDAESCGIKIADLGQVKTFISLGYKGYCWRVPLATGGTIRLIEFGYMALEGTPEFTEREETITEWPEGQP